MAAAEHATGRAFPEQVVEFMDLRLVGPEQAEKQRIHGAGMVFLQIYAIFVQDSSPEGFIL
jgi:hypothetical protein